MQLTQQDIEEFKAAYKEAFGEDITDAEAREMGSRVLWLYELLSKPLPLEKPAVPHGKPNPTPIEPT